MGVPTRPRQRTLLLPLLVAAYLACRERLLAGAEDVRHIDGLLPPGLSLQRHTVRSQGYQLALFRLQGERQGPAADTGSQQGGSGQASPPVPVVLHHGFTFSATVWFLLPREQGLPYILYDAGFDVWALSDRGSTHSQQHDTLSPLQREFWRFTLDDLALNDLPAFVDYVLGATGAQRVSTVTWSAGSTQTFMMSSLLSERYGHDRLCAHVALAPVAFPQRIMAPFMVAVLGSGIDKVVLRADAQLFLPGVVEGVLGPVCCAQLLPGLFKPGAVRGAELTCQLTAALGFGPAVRANQSAFELYSAISWPSSVSAQETAQYAQMYRRGPHTPVLLRYNYGYSCLRDRGHDGSCNLEAYGSREPPEYDLGRYGVATTIISGDLDIVSRDWDRENVQQRIAANGALRGTVEIAGQAHLDFVWADTRVYSQHVVQALQDACGGGR